MDIFLLGIQLTLNKKYNKYINVRSGSRLPTLDGLDRPPVIKTLYIKGSKPLGLDTVELVMAIEKEFNINIPNEDAAKLATVGMLHEYIVMNREKSQATSLPAHEQDLIWEKLKNVVVYQLGVTPEQVTKSANIVTDLGAD